MKFSLIIPTVRQTALVKTCIQSVRAFESATDDYEIIVVDDGSDEKTQGWLKNLLANEKNAKFIAKKENKGFAHTVNIGLKEAKGEYLILLNNDVQFIKPILQYIEQNYQQQPNTGIIGAKLLFPPGEKVQHAGVVRVPGLVQASFIHINKGVNRNNIVVNKSKYYPSVTGALYAIRRACWEAVGDWNENYFLSCEDTEYSLRSWANGWHVFYNHNVEAIHIEGHTRGNTDNIKKRKDMQWFLKERQTIPKFMKDVAQYDVEGIDRLVIELNRSPELAATVGKMAEFAATMTPPPPPPAAEPPPEARPLKKLEIGCGEYPQIGYIHLDIRKFKHVDVVCDFGNEKLPFKDGEIDEILANHSIEHVSWRKLPHVLSEWNRVLAPGGKLFFRTPDLEFIARTYLEGKTTKEHPNDEGFVTANLAATVTPAWWANIKLFAGQDYDGNYHYLAFDFAMAKDLLERYGFERVERKRIAPEFSPGELQVEAYKTGVKAAAIVDRSGAEKILVKRRGALGDVLLTTPIVRRLRELHGAEATIDVATDCSAAYVNNPHINRCLPSSTPQGGYSRVIDLDLAYERAPEQHVIDAYSAVAFGEGGQDYDKQTDLVYTDADKTFVHTLLDDHRIDPTEAIVVHMAVTWKNRTWPKDYWQKALAGLTAKGYKIIVVGHGSDMMVVDHHHYNFMRRLTIQQIAYLISISRCFVANDSGLIHVAGTTSTPIVGLFTSAKGEYRMPYRELQMGYNAKILKPKVSCYGCLHKIKPPVVFADCGRGDYKCLSEITPEQVIEAVG